VLLALTATAVGFAFDAGAGNHQLSAVFSGCYVLGCLLAVLAVRQAALFTAVIQPPLILFVSVPGAYFLFHGGDITGLKDLAINCGYPLIERFPLMFFTAAAVLLVGMGRWYLGMSGRRAVAAAGGQEPKDRDTRAKDTKAKRGSADGLMSTVTAKMAAVVGADAEEDAPAEEEPPKRRRSADRPRRTARTAAGEAALEAREARAARKPVKRATPPRSRHTRPPDTELIEPVAERPRRPRSARSAEPPPVEPRRRSRNTSTRDSRRQPPAERRSSYESYERPERRRRLDDYGTDFEPLEPHINGNGSSTHHPVSRVRYRGADDGDNRTEYRTRPRRRHSWDDYDSER
jgi:hypothetical protein